MKKEVSPLACLFVSIVIMTALHLLFPVRKIIVFPWNLLGIAPLTLGIIFNLIADRAFKKHKTTVKPFEESRFLITTGVFRVSRNPMYLGFALILVGIAMLMGSLTPYVIVIAFVILMDVAFVRIEERMLEEKFGEAWLKCKRNVRRWI